MAMSTCRDCDRMVMLVRIEGSLVATDIELMNVVPAQHITGPSGGSVRMGTAATPARRLHSELCETYRDQARKKRLQDEMRAFNQKNGQPPRAPRKNRGL